MVPDVARLRSASLGCYRAWLDTQSMLTSRLPISRWLCPILNQSLNVVSDASVMVDRKMTKTVGEHWVCATLARHNWAPALTRDGIARTDILAVGPKASSCLGRRKTAQCAWRE